MTPRRLCTLVALAALLISSGCCHDRCCRRVVLFPRLHGGCCHPSCCETGCSTCCHPGEFAAPAPVFATPEPSVAPIPLPMPRPATPMKPAT